MFHSPATLHLLRLCAIALCWLAGFGPARAQFDLGGPKQATPSLVADTAAVAPGKPFTAGVRLRMVPGWHVYHEFSGDSGAPPRINWELPEGFKAGPIQWPLPSSHMDDGDMLTYVFENDVLLMVEITPPATLPPGDVTLKASVDWLVCEKICVPGKGSVELKLPVGDPAPANADLFTRWRGQLPKVGAPPFQVKWDVSKADSFSLRVEGLPKDVKAEFFPFPPEGAKAGHPKTSEIAADGARTITFPIEEGRAADLPWRGLIVSEKSESSREGWLISAKGEDKAKAPAAATASAGPTSHAPTGSSGIGWVLFAAFIGGMILNVMPCVLPVIALKIFGFVHQGGQSAARIFHLGLAFTAGVFTFFLILATAVAQLKTAFNWGYVLQNPYSLSALVALIFAFSLNLLGVFEIALSSGTAGKLDQLSRREGLGGAFLHGLFTTLLGTSCTAPYLAASLGYAATQPIPIIYLIFVAAATGMALPYFLLTARPAWLRFVPKPGAWMLRIKQLMGFIMMAVAVWLFGVLAGRGSDVTVGMSWLLLVVGAGCWMLGTWHESWLVRVALIPVLAVSYFFFLHGSLAAPVQSGDARIVARTGSIEWGRYTDDALAAARKEGVPVFVDFTADWCINCKVYEKTVLATDKVGAKFAEKKILALRADWTNTEDPQVTRALKSFNRVGVPLYVLYRPGENEPVVADALTSGWLVGELDKIK